MRAAQLLACLLPVICLYFHSAQSQISGLPLATAAALGIAGVGASIVAGGLAGGVARALTPGRGGRTVSNTRSNHKYRGRRETSTDGAEDEVENIIETLSAMDLADCGKRYLCELAASPANILTKEERTSLEVFQGKPLVQPVTLGRALFQEAARLGANTKELTICQDRYPACDSGKISMVELIRGLQGPGNIADNDV